jgi:hypothetical protein
MLLRNTSKGARILGAAAIVLQIVYQSHADAGSVDIFHAYFPIANTNGESFEIKRANTRS